MTLLAKVKVVLVVLTEICTSPRSWAVPLLSVQVCEAPALKTTVPAPLVTVAPEVMTRLPVMLVVEAGMV